MLTWLLIQGVDGSRAAAEGTGAVISMAPVPSMAIYEGRAAALEGGAEGPRFFVRPAGSERAFSGEIVGETSDGITAMHWVRTGRRGLHEAGRPDPAGKSDSCNSDSP